MTSSWQNRILGPILKLTIKPIAFPREVTPKNLDIGYRLSRQLEQLVPSPRALNIEAVRLPFCPAEMLSIDGHNERVVLHLHGGGYNILSPRIYRDFNARLARESRARIFSVDYRQGSSNAWPASVDDSVMAYEYLLKLGYRNTQIVVAGDSAGGHLTLCTVLALRDRGLPQPACAIAISPWTNMACDFPSAEMHRHTDVLLDIDAVRGLGRFYARGRDLKDPSISPAFANYGGIAPLYIIASTSEVLLDDARAARDAAMKFGVSVRYDEFQDMPHAFPGMALVLPEAKVAIKNMAEFILTFTD